VITLLHLSAACLVVAALVAGRPSAKVNFMILAATSFLVAQFLRFERRLDRIEDWWQSSSRALSYYREAISPKHPHPWIDATLSANPVVTTLLVGLPVGLLFAFLILVLAAFYVVSVAVLLGYLPRGDQKSYTFSRQREMTPKEQLFIFAFTAWVFWDVLVMRYAKKEVDSLFAFLPSWNQHLTGDQALAVALVVSAWIPLAFIAQLVQRRREAQKNRAATLSGSPSSGSSP